MRWQRRQRSVPDIPAAAMADIAFLLLCFFLAVTTLDQDHGLSLRLPAAADAWPTDSGPICTVYVDAQDQVGILDGGGPTALGLAGLRAELQRRLAQDQDLAVAIRADRQAAYRTFIGVLDEAELAFWDQGMAPRITIAAPER